MSQTTKPEYYDWHKTLSYDADVTAVFGARGIGKTFGLRLQFIRDWKRDKSRFVEIARYKSEIPDVARGYFDRLQEMPECEGYVFRTDAKQAYIARKPDDPKEKPAWEVIGYFVAMTEMQKSKKRTFQNVYRLLLDEATIERTDRYHGYLSHEFELLANIVDSCTRERADDDSPRHPHVYLLSNACDLTNPYFARYGIDSPPDYGYRWYAGKTFLLHYVRDDDYAEAKRTGTVAGRMMAGMHGEQIASYNIFANSSPDFIDTKPKWARFESGVVYLGQRFGIWYDDLAGLYYINDKIPNNTKQPVYALTRADNKVDMLMVKRSNKVLQSLVDLAVYNQLKFSTVGVRERFYDALAMFGIR